MKKLLKNDFMVSLVILVLIVGSFVSMLAPVVTVGNFGVSFFEALHYTKGGLNPNAIPYCDAIIALIVFLSLSALIGIYLVVENILLKKNINIYKTEKVKAIVDFIIYIALSIFLFICIFIFFFGYTEFVDTIGKSTGIIPNWSNREYGYGCIIGGLITTLTFGLTLSTTINKKPSSEIIYGE